MEWGGCINQGLKHAKCLAHTTLGGTKTQETNALLMQDVAVRIQQSYGFTAVQGESTALNVENNPIYKFIVFNDFFAATRFSK